MRLADPWGRSRSAPSCLRRRGRVAWTGAPRARCCWGHPPLGVLSALFVVSKMLSLPASLPKPAWTAAFPSVGRTMGVGVLGCVATSVVMQVPPASPAARGLSPPRRPSPYPHCCGSGVRGSCRVRPGLSTRPSRRSPRTQSPAGLLHPAADPGVHRVFRRRPASRPGSSRSAASSRRCVGGCLRGVPGALPFRALVRSWSRHPVARLALPPRRCRCRGSTSRPWSPHHADVAVGVAAQVGPNSVGPTCAPCSRGACALLPARPPLVLSWAFPGQSQPCRASRPEPRDCCAIRRPRSDRCVCPRCTPCPLRRPDR